MKVRGLLDWSDSPRADAGAHFLGADREWHFYPYTELAERSRSAAAFLVKEGLQPNEVVALGLDTGPDFFAAYFGTLMAGGTPSTIPSMSLTQAPEAYVEHLTGIIRVAQPKVCLVDEGLERTMREACRAAEARSRPVRTDFEACAGGEALRRPAEFGLLQFTSGSSGKPRGVQISYANLENNVAMIRNWLRADRTHATASWLPLYHDMGLIGCMITPTLNQSDMYLMKPMQFIENPLLWLRCFGERGAHMTAAPNFCINYLLRIARRRRVVEQVQKMDFSRWKILILGAERIDPFALRSFAEWLRPQGFSANAFMPAYGLAEATLAVSGVALEKVPRKVLIGSTGPSVSKPLEILEESFVDTDDSEDNGGWITSCGEPLHGVDVSIVDAGGQVLPPGRVGEIVVSGPNVCRGYQGNDVVGSSSVEGGVLRTGDAGFQWGGELYVVGRMGDSIKVNARTVFVEDVEARLAKLPGAREGQFMVIPWHLGRQDDITSIVLVIERGDHVWLELALRLLHRKMGSGTRVAYVKVPRGSIQRTSSGKPRRKLMWRQLVDGHLTDLQALKPNQPDQEAVSAAE